MQTNKSKNIKKTYKQYPIFNDEYEIISLLGNGKTSKVFILIVFLQAILLKNPSK